MKIEQKRLSIPWGDNNKIAINIPKTWKVVQVAEPVDFPPIENVDKALESALENPIGANKVESYLNQTSRITIVVDDISRPTPTRRIVEKVVERLLNFGIESQNIKIVFATGIHRPMTKNEMDIKVGAKVLDSIQCINHNAWDQSNLCFLGKTTRGTDVFVNKHVVESDIRILIGSVEPHPQAGFGGGYKNILPGVAGAKTIGQNHLIVKSPDTFSMIGWEPKENPMRIDVEEVGKMLPGKTFLINLILNPIKGINKIVAGNPINAHREAMNFAKKAFGVKIGNCSDVLITGSYPMDLNLRQAVKCIANTAMGVKKGGLIIGFFYLELGIDDVRIPAFKLPPLKIIRSLLKLARPRAILWATKHLPKSVPVEERFFINFVLQLLRRNQIVLFSPEFKQGLGKNASAFNVYDNQEKLFKWAENYLGKREVTVNIFPKGGITYPIIN